MTTEENMDEFSKQYSGSVGMWGLHAVTLRYATEVLFRPTFADVAIASRHRRTVTTTPEFAVTDRAVQFEGTYVSHPYHQNYDVARDGKSFVMLQPGVGDSRQLIVALNWMTEVRNQFTVNR